LKIGLHLQSSTIFPEHDVYDLTLFCCIFVLFFQHQQLDVRCSFGSLTHMVVFRH